jgi:alkylation response protein AidB-like acyl-CoA dehydrogenase
VDLDLTPEQDLLRDSVRRSCERHAGPDVVRAWENDPVGYPDALWSALGELGLLGLCIDEEYGGSGMTMLDAAVVYEELGRALVPSPHFVSCVLAAGLLARAGSAAQRAHWLPRIADGSAVLSIAWLEPDGGFGPEGVRLAARPDGDRWRLSGVKRHVAFARAADALIVVARGPDGLILAIVDAHSEGVTFDQQHSVASDTQYQVSFTDVPADYLGEAGAAWQATLLDGAVLLAAQAVGGAQAALALTLDYAKTREQFDKPLGAFQAIAHQLSDATTRIDGAQTLVWEAAWARTQESSIATLAPMAKLYACRTFRDVTAMAQQVFGGNGFTLSYDIQLYFRRAKSLQLNWWNDRYLEELIAAELLHT